MAVLRPWSLPMPEIPDLRVLFLTVGEPVSLASLEALVKRTPQPFKLTVWYDSCGRGVDWDFYRTLTTFTDDVFLLTKNHGTSRALAHTLLYMGGKYVMLVLADTVVQEGYLDRFHFAFSQLERIACAGSFRIKKAPWDFLINSKEFMPDGVQMFSRAAINDVGGACPAFVGMGMENREWHDRAISRGWNVVTCNGIMEEVGSMHDGRSLNPNINAEIAESVKTYLRIKDGGYEGFKWWEIPVDISEKKEPVLAKQ